MNVLLIEDSDDLSASIGEYLAARDDVVDYAADGLSGLHLAAVNIYDAVILDLNLPGLDGLSLCKRLREDANSSIPVLMLTARDTEQDKLKGFDAGADDYLVKPFSLPELHARLRALVRRGAGHRASMLQVADLRFDLHSLIARRGSRRLTLTPAGLKLLDKLMRVSPGLVTRQEAERSLWGDHPPDNDAALRGHIFTLRAAVDQGDEVKLLHTVHGVGYRLALDERE